MFKEKDRVYTSAAERLKNYAAVSVGISNIWTESQAAQILKLHRSCLSERDSVNNNINSPKYFKINSREDAIFRACKESFVTGSPRESSCTFFFQLQEFLKLTVFQKACSFFFHKEMQG